MKKISRTPRNRARLRGLTLVEMLMVLVIIALILSGVVMGSGQLSGAKLRKSATMLTGAIKVAYTRATTMSRSMRIVLDFEQEQFWLEEADQPMLVQTNDKTGTGGADPVTAMEQQAVAEGDRIIKGPRAPRPHFHAVDFGLLATTEGSGSTRPLPSGIKFRSIQTSHDDEARTKDRAYIYFWPGGLTERASIQLRIGDSINDGDTMTLLVSPLTGAITIKPGSVDLTKPTDEKDLSEREDRGP